MKDGTEEAKKKLANFDLLVGRKEISMQLLSSVRNGNQIDLVSSLKACVVAATLGPDVFASTVCAIANNLVSSGDVDEAIVLFTLVDKTHV